MTTALARTGLVLTPFLQEYSVGPKTVYSENVGDANDSEKNTVTVGELGEIRNKPLDLVHSITVYAR